MNSEKPSSYILKQNSHTNTCELCSNQKETRYILFYAVKKYNKTVTISDEFEILSNGQKVHFFCVKSMEAIESGIEDDINSCRKKIHKFYEEIQQKRRIIHFFNRLVFQKNFKLTESTLLNLIEFYKEHEKYLEIELQQIKTRLRDIYDYQMRYPNDWESRKENVIKRDGKICSKKGCYVSKRLHLHHITPLSQGGSNKENNLILLCEKHHEDEHGYKFNYGSHRTTSSPAVSRYRTIEKAIKESNKVSFKYRKPQDRDYQERIIMPKNFKTVQHKNNEDYTLCVEGYCLLRKEKRSFALKRMKEIKILD